MTSPPSWFSRKFDSGSKPGQAAGGDAASRISPPPAAPNDHQLEEARLAAKAETLTACAALAAIYEEKNANAGIVRFQLAKRADEAWARLEHHHHTPDPLEEADRGDDQRSASSSGTVDPSKPLDSGDAVASGLGLTAHHRDEPSAVLLLETRLKLIAESLGSAINTVSAPSSRRLLGGASRSLEEYLRTIQKIANGTRAPSGVPEALEVADNVVSIHGHSVKVKDPA